MSEPPRNGPPLREYFEAMLDERDKAVAAALASQEKAVEAALQSADKANELAERNAEKWRQSANEWRGAMSDRDRELPSRREVEAFINGLDDKISALEQRLKIVEAAASSSTGRREGIGVSAGVVVATITAVIGIVGLLLAAVIVFMNLLT
jgi:mevalonate kinase